MPEPGFYITTPIYYVSGEPHLGSTYTTILCDILARFHALYGESTYFLTGTDEHGDRIAQMAATHDEQPQEWADRISTSFRNTWSEFGLAPNDFIRTTEERHKRVVQHIMQTVYDNGDIYYGEYGGLYCYGCERFYTDKEIAEAGGVCPQHRTAPAYIKEGNYFFRMSRYQEWLVAYLRDHPTTIRPDQYRREVLGFLREPLEDLCISRPKSRLTWGIDLPFDSRYVTYVWFDALINYVSALGYPEGDLYQRFWPVAQHMTAKDILKPHGIYWPCMLQAAGIPMYQHLNVHGYLTIGGFKAGKSSSFDAGIPQQNVDIFRRPRLLVNQFGLDGLRYLLAREVAFGSDAEVSYDALVARYNADLANDLGNLLNRVTAMIGRYCGGCVPAPAQSEEAADSELRVAASAVPARVWAALVDMRLHEAVAAALDLVKQTNGYLERKTPWLAVRRGQEESMRTTLYYASEALRLVALVLQPVMPERMAVMMEQLGVSLSDTVSSAGQWGGLRVGVLVRSGVPLFPRIEVERDER